MKHYTLRETADTADVFWRRSDVPALWYDRPGWLTRVVEAVRRLKYQGTGGGKR